ncbi:hypothetical protein ACO0OL_001299 [Hanseniaspora opuntiae]|jgi:ADP-ribosylation factor GTPase-activating protein 1|uniref:ADP-ribosylation factor GTPase-activating protein GCS1 n=1 Tax=Hanseniaspora opuntiae TaxID=211096 RepID=A0A1E5RWP5_9ASCO|nr:ADP-ribosylation factor GTPase-activating protein GCS1 [Hanseniaspora opuntiae]
MSSADWNVDPDNRRKLLKLQKVDGNKECVDCKNPQPQWASPKFGIFICFECAGVHRGLGVHISFVRSITMDQFKNDELKAMELGGNDKFDAYMQAHKIDTKLPAKFKYDNPIAEEYKKKLKAEVNEEEYMETDHKDFDPSSLNAAAAAASDDTANGNTIITGTGDVIKGSNSTNNSSTVSFLEKMGKQNSERPDNLPPSKGGKYSGFGNTPPIDTTESKKGASVTFDKLQKDPLGTLSSGWNIFSKAINKTVADVQENVIKPHVEQYNNGELQEEAMRAAQQFGSKLNETKQFGLSAWSSWSKTLQEQYNDILGEDHPEGAAKDEANETANLKQFKSVKNKEYEEESWNDF